MNYEENPHSKVHLRIKLKNLLDKDTFSKSDPQVIVYTRSSTKDRWREVGRTEVIMNNLNPEFAKPIEMDYLFEEEQQLRFYCMDVDDFKSNNISKNDNLGEYITTLSRIVSAPNHRIKGKLGGVGHGDIIINAEELVDSKKILEYKFSARKLDKKDLFGKSDPFFAIYRYKGANTNVREDNLLLTYESEVIKNTINPSWKKSEVSLTKICNCEIDEVLLIRIYDWNKNGKRDLIGEFETSISELVSKTRKEFVVINPQKKARKGSYKNSGFFIVESCEIKEEHSFLDYLAGRTNFNLTIAVDFTASNKNPAHPDSLHYRNMTSYNEYQEAIYYVSRILEVYSKDKLFPAYGFGAKLPSGQVSHCFALNGNENQPYVFGIEGIMEAYNISLANVTLYGPTNFSPVIKKVIEKAELLNRESMGSNYHVLLIITDGKITDREETIRSIVKASFLPISIIIVGVGNDDFETMNELDADNVPLRDGRTVMNRDIVQFVPYRDCNRNPQKLAKDVLYEIPEQFISYMKQNKIEPIIVNNKTLQPGETSFISEYTPAFDRTSSFIGAKGEKSKLDPNVSGIAPSLSRTSEQSFYNHNPTQQNYSFMSNNSMVYPSLNPNLSANMSTTATPAAATPAASTVTVTPSTPVASTTPAPLPGQQTPTPTGSISMTSNPYAAMYGMASPYGYSYPQAGYPPQGYPPQAYSPQAYPPQAYPQGYPPQAGYPQGYPPQTPGYPPQGYPPQAYSPYAAVQNRSPSQTNTPPYSPYSAASNTTTPKSPNLTSEKKL